MGDHDPRHCSASQTRGSDRKGNNGYLEIGLSFPFSLAHKRSRRRLRLSGSPTRNSSQHLLNTILNVHGCVSFNSAISAVLLIRSDINL